MELMLSKYLQKILSISFYVYSVLICLEMKRLNGIFYIFVKLEQFVTIPNE